MSLELIAPSEIGLVKKQFRAVLLFDVSECFDRDTENRGHCSVHPEWGR